MNNSQSDPIIVQLDSLTLSEVVRRKKSRQSISFFPIFLILFQSVSFFLPPHSSYHLFPSFFCLYFEGAMDDLLRPWGCQDYASTQNISI